VSEKPDNDLDRRLDELEQRFPAWLARFSRWIRQPSARLVRIPVAILLIVGGIFSFLPVLGIWMLPLGLVLIAQDVPFLRPPLARMLAWIERKWFAKTPSGATKPH
jgi:hypothetical protein